VDAWGDFVAAMVDAVSIAVVLRQLLGSDFLSLLLVELALCTR